MDKYDKIAYILLTVVALFLVWKMVTYNTVPVENLEPHHNKIGDYNE